VKYKTFINIVIVAVAALVVGAFVAGRFLGGRSDSDLEAMAPLPPPTEPTTPTRPGPAPQSVPPPAATGLPPGMRDIDLDVERLRTSLGVTAKVKDATKGKPYKISLYSDDGTRFNRAKVDLDRDDKWDEKWTFLPDGFTERQVATADDENYNETYRLEASGWQKK
jgi:hypothetical protein